MHAHLSCVQRIIFATISNNDRIVKYSNAFVNNILQNRR